MDADIVKRMRAEEADLSRKLQAVRAFLSAYGEAPRDADDSDTSRRESRESSAREKVDITSFTEQTRRSVLLAIQAMTTTSKLMKTRDLVVAVENTGHEISGQNKVNALGALLARSEDIVGHGKSGWALADREKAIAIVQKYLLNENGAPPAEPESAPEAAGWGVSPPPPASPVTPPWQRA